MAMPCVRCGAYTASLAMISYVDVNGNVGVVRPLCDKCGDSGPARDARSIPPQAETDSMQIAKSIVNHAAKPLVSAERRREIQLFVDTIKLVENAFHCKLRGDTDLSGDILIFDQANPLPAGYEFSAYIEPNGHLEFTEWVLDDEVGIEGMKQ